MIRSVFNARRILATKPSTLLNQKLYMSTYDPSKVRNVAIIAHVDHGKYFILIIIFFQLTINSNLLIYYR